MSKASASSSDPSASNFEPAASNEIVVANNPETSQQAANNTVPTSSKPTKASTARSSVAERRRGEKKKGKQRSDVWDHFTKEDHPLIETVNGVEKVVGHTKRAQCTSDYEVSEPSSVYSQRQTTLKRKSTGKENDVQFSCPRTPKTRNVGKKTKQDGHNIQSEMDRTPIASTPTARISSSSSDTSNCEVYEPHSVYTRRQTASKRNSKGQENIGASSCPPALKIRNTWDNSNEDGYNSLSKKSKASCRKKVVPTKKEASEYTSPDLEKQRAYFAELDKYELPVEEAEEWELD